MIRKGSGAKEISPEPFLFSYALRMGSTLRSRMKFGMTKSKSNSYFLVMLDLVLNSVQYWFTISFIPVH